VDRGLGLAVPTAFYVAVSGTGLASPTELDERVTSLSRVASIFLLIAYLIFIWFQAHSHQNIFDEILEGDERKDKDRHKDLKKPKLTLTECILALAIAIALVTLIAIGLVQEIPAIVEERHVSESFMGLILVPVVEKAAEHLTAVDEAWDDQTNFALSAVLGSTIQTALFNAPLVVIVGWGLGKSMSLHFDIFNIIVLMLAILVVGNFLRDQKSNYLEGSLCLVVYGIIAAGAFYYPNAQAADTIAIG
jgi:Ca2+:H+ antiporter